MATSEGIPSSIDIELLELNDNPYISSGSYTKKLHEFPVFRAQLWDKLRHAQSEDVCGPIRDMKTSLGCFR